MTDDYDDALHMMERTGGSFVRALAACYYVADPQNRALLRHSFARYFDEYEQKLHRLRAAKEHAYKTGAKD